MQKLMVVPLRSTIPSWTRLLNSVMPRDCICRMTAAKGGREISIINIFICLLFRSTFPVVLVRKFITSEFYCFITVIPMVTLLYGCARIQINPPWKSITDTILPPSLLGKLSSSIKYMFLLNAHPTLLLIICGGGLNFTAFIDNFITT